MPQDLLPSPFPRKKKKNLICSNTPVLVYLDIDPPRKYSFNTIQYNTKFIYIVGDTNSITLAMNSYLPTPSLMDNYIWPFPDTLVYFKFFSQAGKFYNKSVAQTLVFYHIFS